MNTPDYINKFRERFTIEYNGRDGKYVAGKEFVKLSELESFLTETIEEEKKKSYEEGKKDERERIADKVKYTYNGFGGQLGFTMQKLLDLFKVEFPREEK